MRDFAELIITMAIVAVVTGLSLADAVLKKGSRYSAAKKGVAENSGDRRVGVKGHGVGSMIRQLL